MPISPSTFAAAASKPNAESVLPVIGEDARSGDLMGFTRRDCVDVDLVPRESGGARHARSNRGGRMWAPILSGIARSLRWYELQLLSIDLISKENVAVVVGPHSTLQAEFVTYLANKTKVASIAAFVKANEWRNVVLVYEDIIYGVGILPSIIDALQEVGANVINRSAIPASSPNNRIDVELYKLMTMQTRVFIVHMLPARASHLFATAKALERLQPSVTDLRQLLLNGDFVGYQNGSFVHSMLKQLQFDERKIKVYSKQEEYANALRMGSNHGGVSAIFDEIPYLNSFRSQYGKVFQVVGPIDRTGGFGFVLPKGSPLVPDLSKAILSLTEGPEGEKID
ncbi:hypothetical protein E2562_011826 [Oryza meyeriana var. granulata]|uniref:Ionotropic glutamate receptor C-terminal domain-containing protein n=1 Tax=Oryza meyeriana var. granulata TaxID=110450 RepID=A0A6G1CNF4_9ORYZ|nr:hypothetical protein E2562_011826 [Oryza meyeriana var. granulata]